METKLKCWCQIDIRLKCKSQIYICLGTSVKTRLGDNLKTRLEGRWTKLRCKVLVDTIFVGQCEKWAWGPDNLGLGIYRSFIWMKKIINMENLREKNLWIFNFSSFERKGLDNHTIESFFFLKNGWYMYVWRMVHEMPYMSFFILSHYLKTYFNWSIIHCYFGFMESFCFDIFSLKAVLWPD